MNHALVLVGSSATGGSHNALEAEVPGSIKLMCVAGQQAAAMRPQAGSCNGNRNQLTAQPSTVH